MIYGPDLEHAAGARRAGRPRRCEGIPGAVDVRVEQVAGLRYLRIAPDRARLARYGLTIEDVNQLTETMAVGHTGRRGARGRAALRHRRQDRASTSRATSTRCARCR